MHNILESIFNRVGTVMFNPPYESPIEEVFAWNASKYFPEYITYEKQKEVKTIGGNFRLDFYIEYMNNKIAIECDGKEYHSKLKDDIRDALLVGDKIVDYVYRLSGKDINYHTDECFYMISKIHPEIFTNRAINNLNTLVDMKVVGSKCIKDYGGYNYIDFKEDGALKEIHMFATTNKEKVKYPSWKQLYDFVIENKLYGIDAIVEKYRMSADKGF